MHYTVVQVRNKRGRNGLAEEDDMPAIMTHNFFGEQVLNLLGNSALASTNQRDAFLLGNQGPDVFFYALRTPKFATYRKLGKRMHTNSITAEFDAIRTLIRHMSDTSHAVADAYFRGFICHHVLDSTTHPFINYQVDSIVNAGISGLGLEAKSQVHGQIEADIDAMMLWRTRGVDMLSYRPYEEILHANDDTLAVIDRLMRYVAVGAYQTNIATGAWAAAVKDFRTTQRMLYSPTGIKRSLLGRLERLVRPHSLVQAMSPRPGIRNTCEYSNDAHRVWKNPYTGETSAMSFVELFNLARKTAVACLAAYDADEPSITLTRGLTFSGAPYRDPTI